MKTCQLVYIGFKDNLFVFQDERGQKINFSKVNRELIESFDLKQKSNHDKAFKARFFIDHAGDKDIYILCDLEMVITAS